MIMMPQMNINITGVFYFIDKLITIKGNIIVIEFSILSPKQV